MNYLDTGVISFFQQGYGTSAAFDGFMDLLAGNSFLKTGFLISLLWWSWFRDGDTQELRRRHLVASVASGIVAAGVARYAVLILPFRLRPIHEPALRSLFPIQFSPDLFDGWSSFPSDHAVLFFAIAAGLFFVSRLTGILACCWVVFVVCLPRVYLGFHYATDIVAGAVLGSAIGLLANIPVVRDRVSRWPMELLRKNCACFYAGAFLLCWQLATLFNDIREIARSLLLACIS